MDAVGGIVTDDAAIAEVTRFDDLPIPGGVLDADGTIVAVNAVGCALLGRRVADIIGRKAWAFAPGIEHVWAELLSFARERGIHTGELAISTPKAARMIRYTMTVRQAKGRTFVISFATDVTPAH